MENENITRDFKENLQIKQYSEELEEDMKLTRQNIREKSLMTSSLRTKWLKYYFLEKENYSRLVKAKEKLLKKRTGLTSPKEQSLLKMKSEDLIQNSDETMRKVELMLKRVKENLNYLEMVQNILQDFGFTVKNSIEILKMEQM